VLNYFEEERPNCLIVRFEGDIAGQDDKELRKMFVTLVGEGKHNVVADMSRVSFLDSIILGTLVWGMKNLRESDGDMRMFGLHSFVLRLFDITQLDRAFRIFATEDEAVASYD